MTLPQTGGCLCGKIPKHRHCVDCQRLTSSAFSMGSLSPTRPFASWGLSSVSYNARQIVGA
jgi:hypothetical protein